MLTIAAVKAARPKARAYKIYDVRGLHLYVAPTGLRAWRMKFRAGGREQLLSLGHWPDMTLDEARGCVEEARALLDRKEDPRRLISASSDERKEIKPTLEFTARNWHADRRDRWSDRHAADILVSLERNVFPAIGARPIAEIEAAELLDIIQVIEARGAVETARRVRQRLSMIFEFAQIRKLALANPAAMIGRELAPAPTQQHQPALLELEEARALLDAAERAARSPIVNLASRFLALTAVRMNTLRAARWDEFEDLAGAAPLWRIPAAHMKLKKAKKADADNDHLLPLSAAAVEILRQVRGLSEECGKFWTNPGVENGYNTHSSLLVFPISTGVIGDLYARAGYAGRHTPHGWRATFSTILNETFPEQRIAIDQALAHTPKEISKVERAYNRTGRLARRRELYDCWGLFLTGVISPCRDMTSANTRFNLLSSSIKNRY